MLNIIIYNYIITIRCDDVSNILSENFWPDRIGCRLFEKRSRDPATPVPKKTIMGTKPKSPSTNIISLNCEGMRRNLDYINSLLCSKSCEYLCLSETWLLHDNLGELGNINDQYMYTGPSGTDSNSRILRGRPSGGTAILFRKSLSKFIVPHKLKHKRISGCDNFSNTVNQEYVDVVNDIELIINSEDWN